jgi:riboflavin synthase
MFTGLIDDLGELVELRSTNAGKITRIATSYDLNTLKKGASIACSGVCLTVMSQGEEGTRRWFMAEVSPETLAKTTLGSWKTGIAINLERSLRMGDAFDGHFVTAHTDGVACITLRENAGDYTRFILRAPKNLAHFVALKGSVALDGVSLTVNKVEGEEFDIMLIPHTLNVTTFKTKKVGDKVNFEVDLIARYLARLNELQSPLYRQAAS